MNHEPPTRIEVIGLMAGLAVGMILLVSAAYPGIHGPTEYRARSFFAADPMRGNIAEMAFGCNDDAKVTGNILEDEKAGFHWA